MLPESCCGGGGGVGSCLVWFLAGWGLWSGDVLWVRSIMCISASRLCLAVGELGGVGSSSE